MIARFLRWAIAGLVVLFIGIQFVPYGHDHRNPEVRAEPAWDSTQTRELVVRACYACHSNQTVWPWYSNVAPVSWFIQRDVDRGRRDLNFSEWDRPQREARNAVRQVQTGQMPPLYYTWMHPEARLSPAERDELIRGLQATLDTSTPR
ncbi:MAG TPA: heme-binding domain-containing protein [Chloroflexota bacterium]|nr:heme-binding domain-containing protein [Chloroflexota bacterium]